MANRRYTFYDLRDFADRLSQEFDMGETPITVEQAHYGVGYWIIVPGVFGPVPLRWARGAAATMDALRDLADGMRLGQRFRCGSRY